MSDDELVERIKSGDENAAEELVKRYYPSILRYCRWHCGGSCGSREKAEDLTQETFLRLFRSLPRYDGKKQFRAYLYTIASHLCIDESRRSKPIFLENEAEPAGEDEGLAQAEDRMEVEGLLKLLTGEQREAVILRFGEQLSYSEIAKVMGCNMRTAQSRVRNALKAMRKRKAGSEMR